jgi:hypothetical protein
MRMVGKPRCKKKADRLIQKARAFPNQRYHVLYADPPWRYHAQLTEGRKVGNHNPLSAVRTSGAARPSPRPASAASASPNGPDCAMPAGQ